MRWTRYLLYPPMLPTDLVGWLIVGILGGVFGRLAWITGWLVATCRRDSWLGRRFRGTGAATLGHAIVVFDDQLLGPTMKHEAVHVKQLEMVAVAASILASVGAYHAPVESLLAWAASPALVYLCGGVVAMCYGDEFYRGNPDETAAYDRAASKD